MSLHCGEATCCDKEKGSKQKAYLKKLCLSNVWADLTGNIYCASPQLYPI